jgi:signal transduction histidine kinase
MYNILDSVRGRILLVVLVFVSISHIVGLWIYAQRSDASTTLLRDAMLAERISLIVRLVERVPSRDVPTLLKLVSGPVAGFSLSTVTAAGEEPPEGSRTHLLEHLLSAFLNHPTHDNIRTTFSTSNEMTETAALLVTINSSSHTELDHLPGNSLAHISSTGTAAIDIRLRNGQLLHVVAPMLGVAPFSLWKTGVSLAVMLITILPLAIWVVYRWNKPLVVLAAAAKCLGRDIYVPPLNENGPLEIRTTAHAFNVMQEQIRRLVQDRIAIGAAIAHDLGTPVTRLWLRADEIADVDIREPILAELSQMRRMITETLSFARMDFTAETSESIDLLSFVQRVCDEQADIGGDVEVSGPARLVIRTKPMALHRTLSNVIDNAVKYGKRARVTVEEQDETVALLVDDDGPGIPEDMHKVVFEPFRRLQQEENGAEGTGLGLTAARILVRSIGGEITLSNRPEGGLRVWVQLPK